MIPVLCRWRNLTIYNFVFMMYLGIVTGLIVQNYASNLLGLDTLPIFLVTLVLLIPAVVGARILFVAANRDIYSSTPTRIWRRKDGGGALLGSLPLTVIVSQPLLEWLQIPFHSFWDVTTLGALTGLVFVRIGCFMHGCCAGIDTCRGWTLYLPNHRGVWRRRVPTQVLEAGWVVSLLIGASLFWNVRADPGSVFCSGIAAYALGRMLLDSYREKEYLLSESRVVHCTFSIAVVLFTILFFIVS